MSDTSSILITPGLHFNEVSITLSYHFLARQSIVRILLSCCWICHFRLKRYLSLISIRRYSVSRLFLNSGWMALSPRLVLEVIHISVRFFCLTSHALPSISWTQQSFRWMFTHYHILRLLLWRPLRKCWRLIEKVLLRLPVLTLERIVAALS